MSKLINAQEAAQRLGISVGDISKLIKQGIIQPRESQSGKYQFLPEDIDRLLAAKAPSLSEEAAQVDIQIQ